MKILLFDINFWPEPIGIGKYTGDLAFFLQTKGHSVDAITAMPYYPDWAIHPNYKGKLWHREKINGVKVLRCPLYVPQKVSGVKRILHEISFMISSAVYWIPAFFVKYDYVFTVCPPIQQGIWPFLYKKIRKVPFIYHVQDLQLDAALELGMLKQGMATKILSKLENFLFTNADIVSTISNEMKEKIIAKGISAKKILMFPNWVNANSLRATYEQIISFKEQHNWPLDKKIIFYSGNMGEKQGLEIVLEVANRFKNEEKNDVFFIINGAGATRDKLISMANKMQLPNLMFGSLVDASHFGAALNAATLHLIIQKRNTAKLLMPSKLTGILAAGGVVVASCEPETAIRQLIETENLGFTAEVEDAEALYTALTKALETDLRPYKVNAKKWAENNISEQKILNDFDDYLTDFVSRLRTKTAGDPR